ncbi:hypothetical protein GCM10009527_046820 [Actinomadura nitritigenes]
MAPEAEHVSPLDEPEVCELVEGTQGQAFADESLGVRSERQVGPVVSGVKAPVQGADAFGGFGGVLGDVARYGLLWQSSGSPHEPGRGVARSGLTPSRKEAALRRGGRWPGRGR